MYNFSFISFPLDHKHTNRLCIMLATPDMNPQHYCAAWILKVNAILTPEVFSPTHQATQKYPDLTFTVLFVQLFFFLHTHTQTHRYSECVSTYSLLSPVSLPHRGRSGTTLTPKEEGDICPAEQNPKSQRADEKGSIFSGCVKWNCQLVIASTETQLCHPHTPTTPPTTPIPPLGMPHQPSLWDTDKGESL